MSALTVLKRLQTLLLLPLEIRRQYLKNFEGMNLALLNEYLFPNMREYEGKAAGDLQSFNVNELLHAGKEPKMSLLVISQEKS